MLRIAEFWKKKSLQKIINIIILSLKNFKILRKLQLDYKCQRDYNQLVLVKS